MPLPAESFLIQPDDFLPKEKDFIKYKREFQENSGKAWANPNGLAHALVSR